jgi:hypothetical protein
MRPTGVEPATFGLKGHCVLSRIGMGHGIERLRSISEGPSKGPKLVPNSDEPLVLPEIAEAAIQPLEVGPEGRVVRRVPEFSEL